MRQRFASAWVKDFPFCTLTHCVAVSSEKQIFSKSHAEDLLLRPMITRSSM